MAFRIRWTLLSILMYIGSSLQLSPTAMVAVQKIVNREHFENTVSNYMKINQVTRRQAEIDFATYLLDPDTFILQKAQSNLSPSVLKMKKTKYQRRDLQNDFSDYLMQNNRIYQFEEIGHPSSVKAISFISVVSSALLSKGYWPDEWHFY